MWRAKEAFTGFSVKDLRKAKEFYTKTLALKVDNEDMGLKPAFARRWQVIRIFKEQSPTRHVHRSEFRR
jgi:catechol 2,3-dioxygenase-like lactoylglutathione lyase family enzyme